MKFFLLYIAGALFGISESIYFIFTFEGEGNNNVFLFLLGNLILFLLSFYYLYYQYRSAMIILFVSILLIYSRNLIHELSNTLGVYYLILSGVIVFHTFLLTSGLYKKMNLSEINFPIQENWIMSNIIVFAGFVVSMGLISFTTLFIDSPTYKLSKLRIIKTFPKDYEFNISNYKFQLPKLKAFLLLKKEYFVVLEIRRNFGKIKKVYIKSLIDSENNKIVQHFNEINLCSINSKFCKEFHIGE
ncbi:MAG: hypothetical protein KDK36_21855 [Leptospiraceae bacterium]|nr:hypothetical protein [Leptospiraceae bacterium]